MANLNNGAYSTLASGIASDATSLSVASGEGARFPSSNFYISVYDSRFPNWAVAYRAGAGEIMLCSSRTTDALTVTRAQGGTSAVAFNEERVTYRVENNLVAENLTALELPTQTANSAKFLTTDGSSASWDYPKCKQFVYTGSIGSNATVYTIPSLGTNNSTEASVITNFGNNVAIKNLCLRVIGNAGASVTATIRKNTADTTVTCSTSGGGTGIDITNIATYEGVDGDGDTFAIKLVSTASGFTVTATITFDMYYL